MLIWERKDPDETALRIVDWRGRLGLDAISSATFSVVSGTVTLSGTDYDARCSSVLVHAGTVNTKVTILCEIHTEDGQTLQETASMLIKAR